tara:strand:+ start:3457 stop:3732 length:276 start_codon:yes stop_codon:yes gene_type:complete
MEAKTRPNFAAIIRDHADAGKSVDEILNADKRLTRRYVERVLGKKAIAKNTEVPKGMSRMQAIKWACDQKYGVSKEHDAEQILAVIQEYAI